MDGAYSGRGPGGGRSPPPPGQQPPMNASIPRRSLPPPGHAPPPQQQPGSSAGYHVARPLPSSMMTTVLPTASAVPKKNVLLGHVPRRSSLSPLTRPEAPAVNIVTKSETPFVLQIQTRDIPMNHGGIPKMRSSGRAPKRKRPAYEELRDTDSDDWMSATSSQEEPHGPPTTTSTSTIKKGRIHKRATPPPAGPPAADGKLILPVSKASGVVHNHDADGNEYDDADGEMEDGAPMDVPDNNVDSPPPGTLSTLWYSREVFLHMFVVEKILGWKRRPLVQLVRHEKEEKLPVQSLDPVEAALISTKLMVHPDFWNDSRKRMELSRIHPAQCPIVMAAAASVTKEGESQPKYSLVPQPTIADDPLVPPPPTEEVLLVKWRGRSYLHCSWERRKDVEKLDPSNNTAKNKIRRFLQSQEVAMGKNWKMIVEAGRASPSTGGVDDTTVVATPGEDGTTPGGDADEDEFVPPQFTEIERILACDENEMDMHVLAKQRAYNLRAEQEALRRREAADAIVAAIADSALHVHKPHGVLDNLPKISDGDVPWDPEDNVRYVVKWKGLQYAEMTWEYWRDIKRDAVDEAEDFWDRQRAPDPEEVAKILNHPHPHVRDFRKLAVSPQFATSHRPRPVADLGDGFEESKEEDDKDSGKGFELRGYQLEGVNWLLFNWWNKRSCILADEMGLGKTIQSVCFLHQLHELPATQVRGPFLIVAPLSLIAQWQSESQTWAPDLNIVFYHGSADARDFLVKQEFYYTDQFLPKTTAAKLKKQHVTKFHILITTYEVVLKDIAVLSKIRWKALVVDEAHRLKNPKARLFEELATVPRDFCLLLTGTPLQNSTEELWALLHFSDPIAFASKDSFVEKFGQLTDAKQVSDLHSVLKPYLLRRVKEDVEKSLPPKEETILEVSLTPLQKTYYKAIYERNTAFLFKGAKPSNAPSLMNIMMELRKCCNHPFLVRGAEERILNEAALGMKAQKDENGNDIQIDYMKLFADQLVKSSGKMVLLAKLLPKLFAGDHKVLIFSQMVRVLDLLEELLKIMKYRYERLDGSTSASARTSAVDRFGRKSCQRFVMLLSTRAGGLGLNLTAADIVIIFDSDWNPQNDLQAMARAHRIGQTRAVSVYRLLTAKTYEMHMFHSASMKLGLDRAVLAHQRQQGGEEGDESKPKSKSDREVQAKEIDELLKKGAYDVFRDEDDTEAQQFMETDIDQLLERSAKKVTYGNANSSSMSSGLGSFSKASFVADTEDGGKDVDLDDPDFWEKAVGLDAPVETPDDIAAMIDDGVKRSRKQVQVFDPYAAFAEAEQKKKDKIAMKAKEEREEKERLRQVQKKKKIEEKEKKRREREESRGRLFGQGSLLDLPDDDDDAARSRDGKTKKMKKSERRRAVKRAENEDPLLERLKQAWEVPQRNRATAATLRFGFNRFCKLRNESNLTSLPIQDLEVFVRSYIYQLGLQVAVTMLAMVRSRLGTKEESTVDMLTLNLGLRHMLIEWLGPRCSTELEWICNSICSAITMQIEVESRRRFLRMPYILAEPSYLAELRRGTAFRALRRIGLLGRLNEVIENALDCILLGLGHEELGKRGCPTKDLSTLDADLKARHVTTEELSLALGIHLVGLEECRSPTAWWDRTCDVGLLIGTFVHGLGNYEAMRNDEELPFANKIRKHAALDESCVSAFLSFDAAARTARKVFDDALESHKSKAQEEAHAVVAAAVAASKLAEQEADTNPGLDATPRSKSPDIVQSSIMDSDDSHFVTLPRLTQSMVSALRTDMNGRIIATKREGNMDRTPSSSTTDPDDKETDEDKDSSDMEDDGLPPHHCLPMPDARILDALLLRLVRSIEHSSEGGKADVAHLNSSNTVWEGTEDIMVHEMTRDKALTLVASKGIAEAERSEFCGTGFNGSQCGAAHRALDDGSDFCVGAASVDLMYVATGNDAPRYLRAIGVPMNFTRYAVLALLQADGDILDNMLAIERRYNYDQGEKDDDDDNEVGDEPKESLLDAPKPVVSRSTLDSAMAMPSVFKENADLRAAVCAAALHFGFPSLSDTVDPSVRAEMHHSFPSVVLSQSDRLFALDEFRSEAASFVNQTEFPEAAILRDYVETILLPHCVRLCVMGNGPSTRNARGSKGKYETAYGYSLYPDHTEKRQTPLPDPSCGLPEHSIEAVACASAILRRVRLMRSAQYIVSKRGISANRLLEILQSPSMRKSLDGLTPWWCPWIHDLALICYTATRGLRFIFQMTTREREGTVFSEDAIRKHLHSNLESILPKHVMATASKGDLAKWVNHQAQQFPTANAMERRLGWLCCKATAHLEQDDSRYDHLPMFDHGGWPRN